MAGGGMMVREHAFQRWTLLTLLILAGVLNYVDRQIIAVLKPLITEDLRWTDVDYGRMTSLFQLSSALAFLLTGWLVDRLGVRWANPLGVAGWSLAAMAHGWARTPTAFAIARASLGATESMGTPCSIKTITRLFSPEQRSFAFGLSNGAANAGAIVTPLILPALGLAIGWRQSYLLAGAAGLVWAALWVGATRDSPILAAEARPSGPTYLEVLGERNTWGLAGAKALSDQVWWLLLFWAPDFFHRVFGLEVRDLGPPLAVVYACAALGSVLFGQLSTALIRRKLSPNAVRKGLMLTCALLATSAPAALLVQSAWASVGILGLTLAAHQGFSVSVFSAIADVTPPGKVGKVTGLGAFCGNLAGMAILYAAGQILERGLGYWPLLSIAASSYLLAVLWLHLWIPRLTPFDV